MLSKRSITKFAAMRSIITIIFALLFVCSFSIYAQGQYNWDLGMRVGASNYLGEIGGKEGVKLEDHFLVTNNGLKQLSNFPLEKI